MMEKPFTPAVKIFFFSSRRRHTIALCDWSSDVCSSDLYHVVVDRKGIPLAVRLSPANVHDATQLLPLVDQIPSIIGPRGKPGRPRKRPAKLHADKAYDSSPLRRALRARSITPRIARRGIDSSERLGRHRWVVERTLAWLLGCRRLGVRYERRADLLQGLLHLACGLVCVRFLAPNRVTSVALSAGAAPSPSGAA